MELNYMKQEEKDLLLLDLCARLPYKVKVTTTNAAVKFGVISGISIENKISVRTKHVDILFNCTEVKPYLFPISSMTKEQKREYHQSTSKDIDMLQDVILDRINGKDNTNSHAIAYNEIDWLNAHHFDYRGLIEKGLAINATGLNIYKEETK